MFKDDLLEGKRILVTGGGTGLGKEMSAKYAALGAEVIIWGRREGVLQETADEINPSVSGKIIPMACNIKDADAVDEKIAEIWKTHGPLTGLVNNAAGNFISRTQDLSQRGFNAIADIVFRGTFYVTHSVGKRWIAEQQKGSVISILVTWIWTGGPFVVPSAMSKAGVAAMTKSLAVEWGKYGIRLNGIAPGPFPTKGAWERLSPGGGRGAAEHGVPLGRTGEMNELTNLATFLMADGCEYLTGEIIAIDGGQWMNGAGTFARLSELTDAQWDQIRSMIKGANEKDKAQRTA